MYILGICAEHDSSATLLRDGKIVAAAEEERFKRIKHYKGFPENAIKYLLTEAKISIHDVDHVAIVGVPSFSGYASFLYNYYLRGIFLLDNWNAWFSYLYNMLRANFVNKYGTNYLKRLNGDFKKEQLHYINHHVAHAASAYRCSPFNDSVVLTMDAWGDWLSTLMGTCKDNDINVTREIRAVNSLGFLYESLTGYLGYFSWGWGARHEGKVMGMAAYGTPNKDFSDILSSNGNFYKVNTKYVYGKNVMRNLEAKFGPRLKNPRGEIDQHYKDLAATLQKQLEMAVLKLVSYLAETYASKTLCLAGGVAMNCKMNGEVLKSGIIEDLYVQPAAGDNGTSLGAALECYANLCYKSKFQMEHAYWGPEFSNDEIKGALDKYKLDYDYYDDISGVCAELIAKENIVAWFQGRMEWGARALGNRSILADPTNPEIKDMINKNVKNREYWRPFAPSVLEEHAKEYFINAHQSPFMILAFDVIEEKKKEIPAVVHYDGTSRPHTVNKKYNPRYYKLIGEFEKIMGVPVVLNTSFNSREPIVCTPQDAIRTFYSTGLDYLAIGNYLLSKT